MKTILLGNAGAGKTTLAAALIGQREIPVLSLDEIAWQAGVQRRPLEESRDALLAFIGPHEQRPIEGCYGDLVEIALPHCEELIFLNPGVDTCVRHCLQRPWEPSKFASAQEQQAALAGLLEWVKTYETRADEYGLARHRQIYDGFPGRKRELRDAPPLTPAGAS